MTLRTPATSPRSSRTGTAVSDITSTCFTSQCCSVRHFYDLCFFLRGIVGINTAHTTVRFSYSLIVKMRRTGCGITLQKSTDHLRNVRGLRTIFQLLTLVKSNLYNPNVTFYRRTMLTPGFQGFTHCWKKLSISVVARQEKLRRLSAVGRRCKTANCTIEMTVTVAVIGDYFSSLLLRRARALNLDAQ
jgi:hypothetical protein